MEETGRCVLTLPLLTEPYQEHILEKRFSIMTRLRDNLVYKELRKLKNIQRTRTYQELIRQIGETPKEKRKALYKQRQKLLRDAGFSEFQFKDDITPMQKHFADHIAAQIAHKTASDVWRAFEKTLYGNGKKVHTRRSKPLMSIACQKINNGMSYKDNIFHWNGGQTPNKISLSVRVAYPSTPYEKQMLEKEIKYLRVIRKWVKDRYKYYLQFTLAGEPTAKGRTIGRGRVGIDIGTQSIALVSEQNVKLLTLADRVQTNHDRALLLQRKMDRSRRATNPDNYNPDGTIKRGIRLRWQYSANYRRLAGELRHLQRKNADIRKYQHTCLANKILEMGNEIYVEDMDYRALQKRAKKTTRNAAGRYNRKKRFGKSLANRAPAMLLEILQRKAGTIPGASVTKVGKWEFRASQYDHTNQTYHKKNLSERSSHLSNGDHVQRDLYAAFLLMNADSTAMHTDPEQCKKTYPVFYELHNREIQRHLQEDRQKQLTSFGILQFCEPQANIK